MERRQNQQDREIHPNFLIRSASNTKIPNTLIPLVKLTHPCVPDDDDSEFSGIDNDGFVCIEKDNVEEIPIPLSNAIHIHSSITPPSSPTVAWTTNPLSPLMGSNGDTLKNKSEKENFISEQIHHLVAAFSKRTDHFKEIIINPPTPGNSDEEEEEEEETDIIEQQKISTEPFVRSKRSQGTSLSVKLGSVFKIWNVIKRPLHPQGRVYLCWQFVIAVCFIYNSWVIVLRSTFPYQTKENVYNWKIADYSCDLAYLLDMVIEIRLKRLLNGLWEEDFKVIVNYYVRTWTFATDILSFLPFDLLFIYIWDSSLFRLNRLIKIHAFWDFFDKCDKAAKWPHLVRILRTLIYMLFLMHLNACAYYAYSEYEGLGTNTWVYDGKGIAYIRCFLFALKTATSIGKNPKPTNEGEYIFMTCSWLLGVFVFAVLIGQIRDIMTRATQTETDHQKILDRITVYMSQLNIPQELQDRVRQWFSYNWKEHRGIEEDLAFYQLPKKLTSDLALHVHLNTFNKVELFRDLERSVLVELALRLKSALYLPKDYICRKGDVGKEMYIISEGYIQVMGGENSDTVVATLGEGSVFGEISLLGLVGCNRRTADVRSQGFSYLFVLDKAALQETVKNYPEAQKLLRRKAKKIMKNNLKKKEDKEKENAPVVIGVPESIPKLADTVTQVLKSTTSFNN